MPVACQLRYDDPLIIYFSRILVINLSAPLSATDISHIHIGPEREGAREGGRRTDERKEGRKEGRTEGRKDGRKDGRTEGRREGKKEGTHISKIKKAALRSSSTAGAR